MMGNRPLRRPKLTSSEQVLYIVARQVQPLDNPIERSLPDFACVKQFQLCGWHLIVDPRFKGRTQHALLEARIAPIQQF
jgi:hypothetical protein